eukprot:CAMPEP_0178414690 /NCGR_PEP_ID=MMETSP0689_2-20121128/23165_1 /TAXON_ID=160604 /ORGANISM="Amphidinium massartii, Strain CS-259" /LENGTH=405 /DNA_ID=CAMNT_0020035985 /DNA_START=137 /DNA_END=1351 /DNA_ORIENTATION=+
MEDVLDEYAPGPDENRPQGDLLGAVVVATLLLTAASVARVVLGLAWLDLSVFTVAAALVGRFVVGKFSPADGPARPAQNGAPAAVAATANAAEQQQQPAANLDPDPLRWTFVPSEGVRRANTLQPATFDNDLCYIQGVALHRPTHDPERDAAGDYPYSWHFQGRKRVWEVRVQVRFKRLPEGALYFGLEMRYVPFTQSRSTRYAREIILAALRSVLGDEFYKSSGDDPNETDGEPEPPTFAMPLWAIDQFHVAKPGEEWPDVTGNMEGLGYRRTDGLKAYIGALKYHLANLSCDNMYTFCFWGVSRFADAIHWEVRGLWPGFRLDACKLCGCPPVYITLYELPPHEGDSSDRRHLVSRKRYYFKVAMWSTIAPFDEEMVRNLVGPNGDTAGPAVIPEEASGRRSQ